MLRVGPENKKINLKRKKKEFHSSLFLSWFVQLHMKEHNPQMFHFYLRKYVPIEELGRLKAVCMKE